MGLRFAKPAAPEPRAEVPVSPEDSDSDQGYELLDPAAPAGEGPVQVGEQELRAPAAPGTGPVRVGEQELQAPAAPEEGPVDYCVGIPGEAETNVRWYAVWEVRNHPELAGVHWGCGSKAYHKLKERIGSYRSLHFKRCQSLEDAQQLFRKEAPKKNLPEDLALRVFGWR